MRATNEKSNFFSFTLMIIFFMLSVAGGLWLHNLSVSRQEPDAITLPTLLESKDLSLPPQHLLNAGALSLPEAHLTPAPVQATHSMASLAKQWRVSPQTQTQMPTVQEKLHYVRLGPHSTNRNLYQKLQGIFGDIVSFNKNQSQEDHFSVLCDPSGNILLATLIRHNKIYQAVRYRGSDGSTGYYTPLGNALWQSEFLSKPVNYTKITDHFTMHRWHPILHIIRPHYGIDYGAPKGTPVHAVADGKVTFAGWGGGYGNAIIIHHDQRYQSLYAHLNSHGFHVVRSGQFVKKGQIIGYVGATGLTTGPHLHFGLYEYGKAINPARVLPKKNPPLSVAQRDLPDFLAKTNQLFMQFAVLKNRHIMQG